MSADELGPVLKVVLAWTTFAAFHSLTVSEGYERAARRLMGDRTFAAYHRLLFTVITAVAALLLFRYLRSVPDAPSYQVVGWPRLLFHAAQAAGVVWIVWTPWDLAEFVGIRQWLERRNESAGKELSNDRLFTWKAYSVVRHPLYLGFSLILAFLPAQTRTSFVSTVMIVFYFYVGTFFEEARLVRTFGQAYRDYQNAVPRFLPLRFRRQKSAT
jgi:methanethiol S-methyltransferase